jgi:sec-independent protein translocase protein TatA
MIGNIGPLEIGIVLVVALLVFGPRRLPELGSGLGRGMREFKEGVTGEGSRSEPDEVPGGAADPRVVKVHSDPSSESSAKV